MSFSRANVRTTCIAIVAASSLILAGCSSEQAAKPSSTEGAGGVGPITFAMGKNDTDKLTPIIEKWNAAHPDQKVELKELAGEADAQRETLVQSLQAKSSDYDVMALDVVWTAEFAAKGWLQPLDEGDFKVDTSGLLPATVKSATYNGKLQALPQNTNGQLLYRDTSIVPEAPKNWDELTRSCEKAKKANVDCLTTQLKQYEGLTVATASFMAGWGGGILDDSGQPIVQSADSRAGLKALVDGYTSGVISKSSTGATEEETNLQFTGGKTAFAINWPYMYTSASEDSSKVKGRFEVTPLVGKDGTGVSMLGGYNNGINVNSKHKKTALEFMKFIINRENQMSFAEASFPPVLASVYDDPALIQKYPYLPALKQSLENARPRPVSPYYSAISKAVMDNSYAALNGTPVDKATDDMAEAIKVASKG